VGGGAGEDREKKAKIRGTAQEISFLNIFEACRLGPEKEEGEFPAS